MHPSPKPFHLPLALIFLILGGMIVIIFKSMPISPPAFKWAFWFLGFSLWMAGCFHMTIAKGLPAAFGFLGIFFIVGLIGIFLFARKQPEIARAIARRKAENPNKEYRGDPDSLY